MATGERSCETDSIISSRVTIGYGVAYCVIFIIVSIYSFDFLMKYNVKFQETSFIKKMFMWFMDIWKRKACYIPIITHLFDQVTDIAVAIQFYILAQTKSSNDWYECYGLNIWYLFIITVSSMIIYRIISSLLIYESSNKSIKRLIFQLLDFELFRTLYINYLCDKDEPCNPQRWITAMEASLESTPQALVQMIYLVRTNTFTSSYLVAISLISSIWSITSKLISDDKVIVITKARRANFKCSSIVLVDIVIILILIIVFCIALSVGLGLFAIVAGIACVCCPIICISAAIYGCIQVATSDEDPYNGRYDKQLDKNLNNNQYQNNALQEGYKIDLPQLGATSDDTSINKNKIDEIFEKHFEWISWFYVLRFVWRVLDVSSMIFLRTLCWIIVGGMALFVFIAFESIALLSICLKMKQWDYLFGIVALVGIQSNAWSMPDSDTIIDDKYIRKKVPIVIFIYRTITNLIIMILITVWVSTDFECRRCTDYDLREKYVKDSSILFFLCYSWICVVMVPCITMILSISVISDNASLSRDLDKMIEAQNFSGILELQLYSGRYDIYNQDDDVTLLMLAFQEKRVAIVSYLLNRTDDWDKMDKSQANILDYYIKDAVNPDDADKFRTMTEALIKIYKKYPKLKSKTSCNAFICGCIRSEKRIVEEFLNVDVNLLFDSRDDKGDNILDYYIDEKITIPKQLLFKLYEAKQQMVDKKGRNSFLCVAYKQNLEIIDQFKSKYKDIDKCTDSVGDNIYDYLFKIDKFMNALNVIEFYKDHGEYLEKNGSTMPLFYVCRKSKYNIVDSLISIYPQLTKIRDDNNYSVLDYYLLDEKFLSNDRIIEMYKYDKSLKTSKQEMSIFLCVCYHGNFQCMKQLIDLNENVLNHMTADGYNAVSIAKSNGKQEISKYLENECKIEGKLPTQFTGYIKMLLLGASYVGKSTIFKQFHTINGSQYDGLQFKDNIYAQIVEQMQLCLEECDEYKDIELSNAGKSAAEQIQNNKNNEVTPDIAAAIECLWKEETIKLIYDLRATKKIHDSSAYFWDDVKRVAQPNYVPNQKDILMLMYRTTGIIEQKFTVNDAVYHMFDIGGLKSERKKWIHSFETVAAVIYVASLNCFDEVMMEDEKQNCMVDQIELFEEICNGKWFEKHTAMILFLNKTDLFKEKIQSVSITECPALAEFDGDTKSYDETTSFIKEKFESCNKNTNGKQIYTHFTSAINAYDVESVFLKIHTVCVTGAMGWAAETEPLL